MQTTRREGGVKRLWGRRAALWLSALALCGLLAGCAGWGVEPSVPELPPHQVMDPTVDPQIKAMDLIYGEIESLRTYDMMAKGTVEIDGESYFSVALGKNGEESFTAERWLLVTTDYTAIFEENPDDPQAAPALLWQAPGASSAAESETAG